MPGSLWAGHSYEQEENFPRTPPMPAPSALPHVPKPVLPERGIKMGLGPTLLRTLSMGAWKGLEKEEEWRFRIDLARAQAPLPLSRCGVVAVAQPKGGIGKTPTSMLLAASFHRYARVEALLWDVNDNGGARWFLPHGAPCVADLVSFLRADATRSQIASSLVTQDQGSYRVLASRPDRINLTPEEFTLVQGAIERSFDFVIIDTGNSLTSQNLECALQWADVVVIPTDFSDATLDPTLSLLARLWERWGEEWGSHVIIAETNSVADAGKDYLIPQVSAIVPIPFDPHIARRGLLQYSQLKEETKRAGLALVAQVLDVFRGTPTPIKPQIIH